MRRQRRRPPSDRGRADDRDAQYDGRVRRSSDADPRAAISKSTDAPSTHCSSVRYRSGWLERLTNAEPGTLYVAETIVLPAGSHVGHAFTDKPDTSPVARWWSFVDANNSERCGARDGDRSVEANASTLKLVAPAPRTLAARRRRRRWTTRTSCR